MKNSVKIAVCAVSTALSVVLLFLGGVIFVLAYIMPMLSSVLMIMLRKTFGVSGALTTYVSTSLLSLIVVADKECALMYILFFGFYPILYPELKKIKNKLLRAISKLLIFNIMLAIIQFLLVYVFGIPFTEEGEGTVFIVVFAVLMNVIFVIYDFGVNCMYLIYERKIEKKIKKYFK